MSRAMTKAHWRMLNEQLNKEMRLEFRCLGDGRRYYTKAQKDYAILKVDTYGVRATSRILKIPRRTIQRWCRRYNKWVRRCPDWVYEWAERRRKRQEFWARRGY